MTKQKLTKLIQDWANIAREFGDAGHDELKLKINTVRTDMTLLHETLPPDPVPEITALAHVPYASDDAPACPDCGSGMVRHGACFKCVNCGSSLGCS